MDRAIYTAMGAASAALTQQSVAANNLANAATTGFRAQLAAFRAAPVNGPTLATRTLVIPSVPGNDFSPGPINISGNNLDVALDQHGWLAVRLPDGGEAYTRNGRIEIDSAGGLRVQNYPLLGADGQPLTVPPGAAITFGPDGTLSVLGDGEEPKTLVQIGQLKLVRLEPDSLRHDDSGLFTLTATARAQRGAVLPADSTLRLTPGAFEGSNVSPVQTMVEMIGNARSFEMQMKVISNVNDNARAGNQLLAIG